MAVLSGRRNHSRQNVPSGSDDLVRETPKPPRRAALAEWLCRKDTGDGNRKTVAADGSTGLGGNEKAAHPWAAYGTTMRGAV
jgi:hypothetical protein